MQTQVHFKDCSSHGRHVSGASDWSENDMKYLQDALSLVITMLEGEAPRRLRARSGGKTGWRAMQVTESGSPKSTRRWSVRFRAEKVVRQC